MVTISEKPWGNIKDSDYKDADDLCSASLIDLNPSGQTKTKDNCKLRVYEPNGGPLNRNGVHAAAVALAGGRSGLNAPQADKAKAARKLVILYGQLKETPPDSIKNLAGK